MIQCNNVQEQARDLSGLIVERWRDVLEAGDFVLGEEVSRFETWMSQRCGGACAIAMNSGTDALLIALRALGVGPGHEVVTCANTFVATVGAIVAAGARPVLADVGDDELVDIDTIAPLLSARTKAVIPVHLRGRPVDVAPIVALCRAHGVAVVEDCAQAIGTTIDGRQVGTAGDAAAFSLHPLKTLGALGDGGVLVTTDPEIAEYAKSVRNHGLQTRDEAIMFGINSRLDSLQAAALNVKVRQLDSWLDRRKAIAAFYDEALAGTDTGTDLGGGRPGNAYYHYVVRSGYRDRLRRHLDDHGIQAAIHYPIPIHRQRAWLRGQPDVSLPNTERLAREILTIPCHHHLSDGDVERIATAIRRFR
ncbi:DegT/DnrJ/EryC1/StrS family aminotransferase [Burkholderia oklahomensis]|uniref:DegT/DnrJ/EryC1/StrS family aminotransferase n=1 Tax=Burkholderia oklahomensis TaxID=342113 RepID=UPI00016A82C3|nr:DegT/DnrJ/EryC1/StrS family aminotransferase [Burkholderia oklahomensis]AJX31264.1 beta-eliminating lyase family protein [Burkholderia oklahomensis C6786]AOI46256.1 transcriptional regulator [Burkholderia oklahomensis C6786]KUY53984.1 transcriptional regulator [Burkholderia oklahomensis C6786]MBI0361168.1 DegT/DnrJ/EryC1/StrS family aminotransferase [Burkholderia oklahomensis]SUW54865.1 UDP-4-amino-4-deoxy-L-arabinose--oxoglutarate aminotransferase [Burkholderia oklahomensis]